MYGITAEKETRWYSYAGKRYKVVYRTIPKKHDYNGRPKEPENEKKWRNIKRAIQTVHELAICNNWRWWITITLDGSKIDRYNLPEIKRKLSQWMRDVRKRKCGGRLAYLLIPEQHADGAWHIHGLLNDGLIDDDLSHDWQSWETLPNYIRRALANGVNKPGEPPNLLWWPLAASKWGYNTVERIRSVDACAAYCSKYMAKGLRGTGVEDGKALYIASKGLQRATLCSEENVPWDCTLQSGYKWMGGAVYWYDTPAHRRVTGYLTDYTEGKKWHI